MKISSKAILALVALTLATTLSASAFTLGPVRQEISAGGLSFLPKDDNSLYNNGYGAELQYRFWLTDDWALALALGAARLNVAHDEIEIAPGTDGTVDILPVGADIVFNLLDIQPVRLNAHAGARYIFTRSDASCLTVPPPDVAPKRVDMTIDNGAVWRVGLDANCAITKSLALFGSASYQSDFAKQGISTADGPLRDNTFRAFILEAGLLFHF